MDTYATPPNPDVIEMIGQFKEEISSLESEKGLPFILFQDGKSQAYYIECHLNASLALPLIDFDATLDPEEQEEFRLQRELQPTHRLFLRMILDAIENRQFSDIIAEYNTTYRPELPLKLLGGQHRAEAINKAIERGISRHHGFRIYFGLSVEQRNEIAQIANTNIAISADLIDRMQETSRGPQLRDFCHETGLLEPAEDFSDRRRADEKITVRIARTFIVNFYDGRKLSRIDPKTKIFMPYICAPGQEDQKYLEIIRQEKVWDDDALKEAAREFSKLHKKQIEICSSDPTLDTGEFRNKATSFSVLSSWAFVAGYLQDKPEKLAKLYSIPEKSGKSDPLAAKVMSESKHPKDPSTYRGLGVRYGEEDKGRVTELFIQFSEIENPRINKALIEVAIMQFEAKIAIDEAKKSRSRLK